MDIRAYRGSDETAVIELWIECGLTRPWNDPKRDIARKLTEQPELFLVGEIESRIVAAAMFGFDGTRGWVHYLGVAPASQGRGFGRQLMLEGERLLHAAGCPKLNLQIRTSNLKVIAFYERLGYTSDDVVSMGKRLIPDATNQART